MALGNTDAYTKPPDLAKAKKECQEALVPLKCGRFSLVTSPFVKPGDPAGVPAEARMFLREQMTRALGGADLEAFVAELRRHAKIEMEPQRL